MMKRISVIRHKNSATDCGAGAGGAQVICLEQKPEPLLAISIRFRGSGTSKFLRRKTIQHFYLIDKVLVCSHTAGAGA